MNSYESSLTKFTTMLEAQNINVSVYVNNTLAVHCGALSSVYPITKHCLGEQLFNPLAKVYSDHYPSDIWDINQYGSAFSELLSAQVNSPKKSDIDWFYISRIAALEYAIVRCYYADNSDLCSSITLQGENRLMDISSGCSVKTKLAHDLDLNEMFKWQHPYVDVLFKDALSDVISKPISIRRNRFKIEISPVSFSEHMPC